MDVTGDNVPTKSGLSLADYAGGTVAALALVSGLHAARRDGIGMDCDLSLYDTAMHFVGYPATYALTTGYKPKRMKRSAHPTLIPFQAVPTQDGWAVLAVAKEKFWHRLAEALQKPEWLTDPRFVNFAARDANREFVVDAIEAETAKYPTATLIPLLESHGVPCGPVNSIPESLKDPHFAARDLLIEYEHDTLGDVKMVASPVKIGGIKAEPKRGPRRGEHNEEMLKELGFSSDEVDRLKKEGAFGGAKKKVEDDD